VVDLHGFHANPLRQLALPLGPAICSVVPEARSSSLPRGVLAPDDRTANCERVPWGASARGFCVKIRLISPSHRGVRPAPVHCGSLSHPGQSPNPEICGQPNTPLARKRQSEDGPTQSEGHFGTVSAREGAGLTRDASAGSRRPRRPACSSCPRRPREESGDLVVVEPVLKASAPRRPWRSSAASGAGP
jgi:hypothetical protein